VNNVGSKTLFNAVEQRAQRFLPCMYWTMHVIGYQGPNSYSGKLQVLGVAQTARVGHLSTRLGKQMLEN
jgi:hypothetical protein